MPGPRHTVPRGNPCRSGDCVIFRSSATCFAFFFERQRRWMMPFFLPWHTFRIPIRFPFSHRDRLERYATAHLYDNLIIVKKSAFYQKRGEKTRTQTTSPSLKECNFPPVPVPCRQPLVKYMTISENMDRRKLLQLTRYRGQRLYG